MQKIITREETEKKENRNKAIIGIILVGLMVFSTAGYALFQSSKTSSTSIKYKGIKFSFMQDGLWHWTIENNNFATSYNPAETSNISSNSIISLNSYSGKELYLSYDSDRQAVSEITMNLNSFLGRVQYACTDSNCQQDLPVKNCSDNVIIARVSNITARVVQEDSCVYIMATQEDIIKASDKFIFGLLGI